MRLKELQIFGFKSFPNKTTIKFSDGITAIIGPNGCGKTNILDALRWVLGEQSFSILRCNKNEELIFAGTAKHPPLGYTEVKLILENNGDLPNFGSEIEIKRKYFRSGASEFYINRNPCRLKDIQELFFNSGTGSKAYSIFDLPRMREIIAGGTRRMFEEVANLARYRERKNETLNKLTLTESELLRLNDVIAERKRYTKSLRRQARRLEVYERLRQEEKKLKLVSLKTQYLVALKSEINATASLKEATAQEEKVLLEITQAEKELEKIREQLRQARNQKEALTLELDAKRQSLQEQEKLLIAKRERINYLQLELKKLQTETKAIVAKITETKQAQEFLAKAIKEKEANQTITHTHLENIRRAIRDEEGILFNQQVELEQAKTNLQSITDKVALLRQKEFEVTAQWQNRLEAQVHLKAEMENLNSKILALKSAITQNENRIATIDQQLSEMKKAQRENNLTKENISNNLSQLQQRCQSKKEVLASLKQEIHSLKIASGQEQREIVQTKLGEDFLGACAEFLTVKEGYELPVEACLYAVLDFLVVKDRNEPLDFHSLLPTAPWGTTFGFLIRSINREPTTDHAKRIPSNGQRITDFVEIKPNAPQLLAKILNDFILVENFNTAWELSRKNPQFSFVTKDGIALFADGLIVIEGKGRLTIEKKLKEKFAVKTNLENDLATLNHQIQTYEATLTQLDQEFKHRQDEILNLLAERSKLVANLTVSQNALAETKQELDWLNGELSQTQAHLVTADKQASEIKKELNSLISLAEDTKTSINQLEQAIAERQKSIKEKLRTASEVLADFGKTSEALTALKTAFDYKTQELQAEAKRMTELAETEKALGGEIENLVKAAMVLEQEIETNKTAMNALRKSAEGRIQAVFALAKEEEALQNLLKEKRSELEAVRTQVLQERMKQFEMQKQREVIEREAQESYATDIATVEIMPDEQVSDRLKIIAERILSLGKVNPLAKDEYEREKAELDKYLTQRQDVLSARDNLQKTIIEIENHAKDQFLQTFGLVRERFRSIFTRLFIEGEADLILASEANPLESEIEIIARPKGKMPKRLEHLSDGEKALLALSLLFAFYSVKPAPFCFFDEVDAPLDDVNVGRFADFLRELAQSGTQAVVITHNRMTIEKADVLLGVTTEEPGVSKVISVRLSDLTRQGQTLRDK
uniref:Chromosome partition protein Smc n=1 Tax=candidate division WOR-3 bacterium TaxID=2052148 RepID=A0A7C6EDD0_UNCW3